MAEAAVPPRRPEQIPVVQPPVLQENPGIDPRTSARGWRGWTSTSPPSTSTDGRRINWGIATKFQCWCPCSGLRDSKDPSGLRDSVTYTQFRQALTSEFGQTVTVEKCHFDYFRQYQEQGETVQEYIGALRTLAADCNFKGTIQEGTESFLFPTRTPCSRLSSSLGPRIQQLRRS